MPSGQNPKQQPQNLTQQPQNLTQQQLIKIINQVDSTGEASIILQNFLKIIPLQNNNQTQIDQEDIYLPFLVIGGDKDKDKSIDRQKLISVIKDQFNLSIDIARLIKQLDINGNHDVEYSEFKNLFIS